MVEQRFTRLLSHVIRSSNIYFLCWRKGSFSRKNKLHVYEVLPFSCYYSMCLCVYVWLKHKAVNSQIITPLKNHHEQRMTINFCGFHDSPPELGKPGNALKIMKYHREFICNKSFLEPSCGCGMLNIERAFWLNWLCAKIKSIKNWLIILIIISIATSRLKQSNSINKIQLI